MDEFYEDDPYDWDVQKVVEEVVRNPDPPWLKAKPSATKVNIDAIASSFYENDVYGELFLTGIGESELRTDLNIRSMGQRRTILLAILFLQKQSRKYHALYPQQSNYVFASPQTTANTTNWFHTSTPATSDLGSRGVSPRSAIAQSLARPPPPPLFYDPVLKPSIEEEIGKDLPTLADSTTQGNIVRGLGLSENAALSHVEAERPFRQSGHSIDDNDQALVRALPRKVKRIRPTFLGPVGSHSTPDRTGSTVERYMTSSTMNIEDIFYPILPEMDNDRSFYMDSKKSPGNRQFVHKAMRYFLQQPVRSLETNTSVLFRFSYPSWKTSRRSRFFTMFAPGADPTKQSTASWPVTEATTSGDIGRDIDVTYDMNRSPAFQEGAHDDYLDRLLQKYPPNNTEVIDFDDVSDGGESLDDETWAEVQKELEENRAKQSSYMSTTQINEIIDTMISQYVCNWKENKSLKVAAKAFKAWERAALLGRRKAESAAWEAQARYLAKKIERARSDIAMHVWRKAADLEYQCQSLEEYIYQQEEAKHLAAVLMELMPPARPTKKQTGQVKPLKPQLDLSEDEEVLESDSDISINDFVVEDAITSQPVDLDETIDGNAGDDEMDVDEAEQILEAEIPEDEGSTEQVYQDAQVALDHEVTDNEQPSPAGSERDLDTLPYIVSKSRFKDAGDERDNAVVLSSDSAEAEHAESSTSQPPRKSVKRKRSQRPQSSSSSSTQSSSASLYDLEAIRSLNTLELESESEHKKLLVKLIIEIDTVLAQELLLHISQHSQHEIEEDIKTGVQQLVDIRYHTENSNNHDLEDEMFDAVFTVAQTLARLYICFHFCRWYSGLSDIPYDHFTALPDRLNGLRAFVKTTRKTLKKGLGKETSFPVVLATTELSDDDRHDKDAAAQTPHKKRRKEVQESQDALEWQRKEQVLMEDYQKRKLAVTSQLELQGGTRTSLVISYGEVPIFLDPQIGSRAKPHQVSGIEFIWREVVASGKEQGCLLAHTMGFGKTMQVIAFLSTLAQVAASPEAHIRDQIPERLRGIKALVLAPASLVLNWVDEFAIWTPAGVDMGRIRHLTAMPVVQRQMTVAAWAREGGVLLTSYETFRNMIIKQPKGTDDNAAVRNHEVTRERLLNAKIIVADEAHRMKNNTGRIFQAASMFKSKSRIALTGSPLANSLEEYYAMIQWVAPGYLGEIVQFKAKYSEPIAEGLYQDSSASERRKCLRRLHLLKKILEPKIHRADIGAIASDMPQKTEFFLTIPLTDEQCFQYKLFAESMLNTKDIDKATNARIFTWLALLALLCNHPAAFAAKLEAGKAMTQLAVPPPAPAEKDGGSEAVPLDQYISFADVFTDLLEQQMEHLHQIRDLRHPKHSVKATLVEAIIRYSIEADDKILLFSHTLLGLDYYEDLLRRRGIKFARIDGSTNISHRQTATKAFNHKSSEEKVFLISMRAGGLGLNIQGANRVVILDFGFNPTWEEQAIGRAYRLGQKKPVFVYRFRAGGTFEDVIYNKAVFKTQLSARVVDSKSWISYATKKAKDYLFVPREVDQHDLTEFQGKDPRVLDEILRDVHNIRNIELTETFQREDDEQLTPEEIRQIQQELDDEKLQRDDPIAFHHLQLRRIRVAEELRQARLRKDMEAFQQAQRSMTSWDHSFVGEGLNLGPHSGPNKTYEPEDAAPYVSLLGARRPRASSVAPDGPDGPSNHRTGFGFDGVDESEGGLVQEPRQIDATKLEQSEPVQLPADCGIIEISSDDGTVSTGRTPSPEPAGQRRERLKEKTDCNAQ